MDTTKVKGLIIALFSPKEPALDGALNRWMDEAHCPDAAETPGVVAWARYENIAPQPGQPRYANVYELDRPDADAAKAWLMENMARKREQGRWQPVASTFHFGAYTRIHAQGSPPAQPEGFVLALTSCLDQAREDEYNRWYNTQHMPAILTTPGMTGGVRFKAQHCDFTPAGYAQFFLIGSPDVAGVRAAMQQTLAGYPERVRSSAGLAKPVLVATFKRRGDRRPVQRR